MEKKNLTLSIILILVFLILISAFLIEYKLDHKPCKLCIYQRIPYFVAILLSFSLAFYHFGIEEGFFKESVACSTENFGSELTKEEILEKLKQSSISCKNVSFRVLGLSLASINSIFSITLSVIFLRLFINYGKN